MKTGQVKGAAAQVGEDDLASLSRNTGAMRRCVVDAHVPQRLPAGRFLWGLDVFWALVSRARGLRAEGYSSLIPLPFPANPPPATSGFPPFLPLCLSRETGDLQWMFQEEKRALHERGAAPVHQVAIAEIKRLCFTRHLFAA